MRWVGNSAAFMAGMIDIFAIQNQLASFGFVLSKDNLWLGLAWPF